MIDKGDRTTFDGYGDGQEFGNFWGSGSGDGKAFGNCWGDGTGGGLAGDAGSGYGDGNTVGYGHGDGCGNSHGFEYADSDVFVRILVPYTHAAQAMTNLLAFFGGAA